MRDIYASLASSIALITLTVSTNAAVPNKEKPHMQKLGDALTFVATRANQVPPEQMGKMGPNNEITLAQVSSDGYVLVDAVAQGEPEDLLKALEALGARNISSYGRIFSSEVPAERLENMALMEELAFVQPTQNKMNAGLVIQQGDRAMATDLNRNQLGLNGDGFTVGILSDTIDCDPGPIDGVLYTTPEEDIANGDIPADYQVLEDINNLSSCIDEGRAMAQLIIDIVPEAKILFHSAQNGVASFAQGIIELAEAGADVIVDDVIYLYEPMFQDGVIAQAADTVSQWGIPYYSSAGNEGRKAYGSDYRPVTENLGGIEGIWHDWDESENTDLLKTITLDGNIQTAVSLQWDSPNFSVSGGEGANNNVDLIAFDMEGNPLPNCFVAFNENGFFPDLCQALFSSSTSNVAIDGGNGGDAIELAAIIDFIGGSTIQLGLLTESGDAPGRIHYVLFGGNFLDTEYPINSPTIFGHANAQGAEAVGSSAFVFTEAFNQDPATLPLRNQAGEPACSPSCLNDDSSAGGIPILFDLEGNRLKYPETRIKPGVSAVDGINTTFFRRDIEHDDDNGNGLFERSEPDEYPNFFGTSASAPNAAAVAVQMLQAAGSSILDTSDSGDTFYWMCKPLLGIRSIGFTQKVTTVDLREKLDNGFLLGQCSRPRTKEIYLTMRLTAEDMTTRAHVLTGETVATFDETGFFGFDFDSGFGLINAPAAVEAIQKRRRLLPKFLKEKFKKH